MAWKRTAAIVAGVVTATAVSLVVAMYAVFSMKQTGYGDLRSEVLAEAGRDPDAVSPSDYLAAPAVASSRRGQEEPAAGSAPDAETIRRDWMDHVNRMPTQAYLYQHPRSFYVSGRVQNPPDFSRPLSWDGNVTANPLTGGSRGDLIKDQPRPNPVPPAVLDRVEETLSAPPVRWDDDMLTEASMELEFLAGLRAIFHDRPEVLSDAVIRLNRRHAGLPRGSRFFTVSAGPGDFAEMLVAEGLAAGVWTPDQMTSLQERITDLMAEPWDLEKDYRETHVLALERILARLGEQLPVEDNTWGYFLGGAPNRVVSGAMMPVLRPQLEDYVVALLEGDDVDKATERMEMVRLWHLMNLDSDPEYWFSDTNGWFPGDVVELPAEERRAVFDDFPPERHPANAVVNRVLAAQIYMLAAYRYHESEGAWPEAAADLRPYLPAGFLRPGLTTVQIRTDNLVGDPAAADAVWFITFRPYNRINPEEVTPNGKTFRWDSIMRGWVSAAAPEYTRRVAGEFGLLPEEAEQ